MESASGTVVATSGPDRIVAGSSAGDKQDRTPKPNESRQHHIQLHLIEDELDWLENQNQNRKGVRAKMLANDLYDSFGEQRWPAKTLLIAVAIVALPFTLVLLFAIGIYTAIEFFDAIP